MQKVKARTYSHIEEEATKDILNYTKCDPDLLDTHGDSEVARFYKGRSVFITGASGFVGKCLLEKILRSCPDLKEAFILMRPKRGLEVGERVEALLKSNLFDRLRAKADGEQQLAKIKAIKGDITRPFFGISEENIQLLSSRVSLIFHSAATVKFSEPLKVAAENNIVSVGNLIDFGSKLANLEALVHVSTAYSNCDRTQVGETFYEAPIPADKLIDLTHWMNPDVLDQICPTLLGNRPNTYTLTKAVAESLLRDKCKKLLPNVPIAMIRPSIVAGTFREPIPGWVDNYNGPTGVIVSMMLGALQAMYAIPEYCADIVPVDMVASLIICAARQVHNNYHHDRQKQRLKLPIGFDPRQTKISSGEDHQLLSNTTTNTPNPHSAQNDSSRCESPLSRWTPSAEDSQEITIFNCVSGPTNPVLWADFTKHLGPMMSGFPCNNLIRQPSQLLLSNKLVFDFYNFVNHTLIAYVGDFALKVIGRKGKLVPIQKKLLKMIETLKPFTTNQWNFNSSNVTCLYERLTPVDREIFNFDIRQVSWEHFIQRYYIGTKLFVLKDDPRELTRARKNLSRVCLRSRIAQTLLIILVYYLMLSGSSIEQFAIETFSESVLQQSFGSTRMPNLLGEDRDLNSL